MIQSLILSGYWKGVTKGALPLSSGSVFAETPKGSGVGGVEQSRVSIEVGLRVKRQVGGREFRCPERS